MSLADLGIRLCHPDRVGEHRAPCPQCDRGPRDDALAVRVKGDGGVTWLCHRCGWSGAQFNGIVPTVHQGLGERQAPHRYGTLAPWARAFWAACRPIWPDTIAGRYLAARGCALPPWPDDSDLKWHPEIKHPSGHVGPAMVGLVTDILTAEPISLHRTWITAHGKADLEKPRLLLKRHRADGVIRLWPDAEVTIGLGLAEGIETALVAARGFTPMWATLSAGNLKKFPVLPGIECLTVFVDNDAAGLIAWDEVSDRWAEADREARRIVAPKSGDDLADWVCS
jgi:putative DNA primase/helicase